MSVTQKLVTGEQVEGMDACIRGLQLALKLAHERDGDLTYLDNEVEAIAEHWERLRGPMPPDPEEEA